MQNDYWKKGLVLGIIILFIGASITTSISGNINLNIKPNSELNIIENRNHLGDPPEEEWNKTYNGGMSAEGYSVDQTSDGGYIAAGGIHEDYFLGAWLIKTDSNGNEQWNKSFEDQWAHSVYQTSDGGYILGIDKGLIKTDENGNEIWRKILGKDCLCMQKTSDGGYIINRNKGGNLFLIKTNSTGFIEFNETHMGIGTSYNGKSIQQTSEGGYITTGSASGGTCLLKVDSNGIEEWKKTYGGLGGKSVNQTNDGGYIILTTIMGRDEYQIKLIKTDEYGDELWNQTHGGPYYNEGNCIKQTTDGGYIIAGETDGYFGEDDYGIWLLKTDANGIEKWNLTWAINYNYCKGFGVQQTTDGGYIVVGALYWDTIPNQDDLWLIKVAGDNNCPDIPNNPDGPTSGSTKIEYTYSTSTTDPEGDDVCYNFSWGDGSYSGWSDPYNSGETAEESHTWMLDDTYGVRVKAKDEYNLESDWSDPSIVVVDPGLTTYRGVFFGIRDEGWLGIPGDNDASRFVNRIMEVATNWELDNILLFLNHDANISNYYFSMDWLSLNADSNDVSVFYFSGHGGRSEQEPYFYSIKFDDAEIGPDLLDNSFDPIRGQMIVIIHACNSGGFIDELKDQQRVIITSCKEDESSYPCLFEVGWFMLYMETGLRVFFGRARADYNSDKFIDIEELYQYTWKNMWWLRFFRYGVIGLLKLTQTPQINDGDPLNDIIFVAYN